MWVMIGRIAQYSFVYCHRQGLRVLNCRIGQFKWFCEVLEAYDLHRGTHIIETEVILTSLEI